MGKKLTDEEKQRRAEEKERKRIEKEQEKQRKKEEKEEKERLRLEAKRIEAEEERRKIKEYRNYLNRKEFGKVKEAVFQRDNYTCRCCGWNPQEGGKRSLQAHHIDYSVLYDEMDNLDHLVTLCTVCHRAIHTAVSNKSRFKFSHPRNKR